MKGSSPTPCHAQLCIFIAWSSRKCMIVSVECGIVIHSSSAMKWVIKVLSYCSSLTDYLLQIWKWLQNCWQCTLLEFSGGGLLMTVVLFNWIEFGLKSRVLCGWVHTDSAIAEGQSICSVLCKTHAGFYTLPTSSKSYITNSMVNFSQGATWGASF